MKAALLLDTHALIWLMEGASRLSPTARQLAEEAAKDGLLRVSAISLWEIATLESKGRISFDRVLNATLLTADTKIHAYAKSGYLSVANAS